MKKAIRLLTFFAIAWMPAIGSGMPLVQTSPLSSRPAVKTVLGWYAHTLNASTQGLPDFGVQMHQLVHRNLAELSTLNADDTISRLQTTLDFMESQPAQLTPQQAADILSFMLILYPEETKKTGPYLADLQAALLGEIVVFSPKQEHVQDGDFQEFSKQVENRLVSLTASFRDGTTPEFLARLFDGANGTIEVYGRTHVAVLPSPQSFRSRLAVKLLKPNAEQPGDLDQEARNMGEIAFLGDTVPEPVPDKEGRFELTFHNGQNGLLFRASPQYFIYLNDRLPATMSREERITWLKRGAMRAIDHMVRLFEKGYVHESLTALTHRHAFTDQPLRWRWSYTRWADMRFGPTPIHKWPQVFFYPNMGPEGLRDWFHLVRLNQAQKDMSLSMNRQGLEESEAVAHFGPIDVEHTLIGQNLTEWALITLHSAAINHIPMSAAAEIVWQGLKEYAIRLRGGKALQGINEERSRKAIRLTGRRLKLFTFLSFIGELPGGVTHPLIMEVVWPITDVVRGKRVEPEDYTAEPPFFSWLVFSMVKPGWVLILSSLLVWPLSYIVSLPMSMHWAHIPILLTAGYFIYRFLWTIYLLIRPFK